MIRQTVGKERNKLKKKIAGLLISIITAAVVLSGCGIIDGGAKTKFSDQYFDVFDTVVSVTAYCKDRKGFDAVNTQIHDTLKHYHQLFDIYNEYDGMNNAATINKLAGTGELTEVEPALAELIEYTRSMYVQTNGKVNAAMGAVLSLWHEARTLSLDEPAKAYIPSTAELKDAAQHCSMDSVFVDMQNSRVRLDDPDMSLDLGAFAKGWAVEKAAQLLESKADELAKQGVGGIIISAGGNVRMIGEKPEGTWTVAIQDPDSPDGSAYIAVIENARGSVVTSGAYQRYYECNGKKYHHIIDGTTLMPEDRYLSVSVKTADSGYADALSTALFNMDLEESKAFAESLEGVEVLWVLPDRTMVKTTGW